MKSAEKGLDKSPTKQEVVQKALLDEELHDTDEAVSVQVVTWNKIITQLGRRMHHQIGFVSDLSNSLQQQSQFEERRV